MTLKVHKLRCRVVDQLTDDRVEVLFVDYGNKEVKERVQLLVLDPDFKKMAPAVVRIRLFDTVNVDNSKDHQIIIDRISSLNTFNLCWNNLNKGLEIFFSYTKTRHEMFLLCFLRRFLLVIFIIDLRYGFSEMIKDSNKRVHPRTNFIVRSFLTKNVHGSRFLF